MGLDAGADDYLAKPFKIAELLARSRSLIRRASSRSATPTAIPEKSNSLVFSDLVLNLDEKNAKRNGIPLEFTATEFRILE